MSSLKAEFLKKQFPASFTYWWIATFINVFLFDILWMLQTTFRPTNYIPFWTILFLFVTLLTVPSLFSRNGFGNTFLLLLFDLIGIANLMYCRTYYNAIPLQSYFLIGNLSDFSASVYDSFKWYYISLPILTIISFLIYRLFFKKVRTKIKWQTYMCCLCCLLMLSWASDAWRGGALAHIDELQKSSDLTRCVVPIYTIPGFLIYDYLRSNGELSPEDKKNVKDWLTFHESLKNNGCKNKTNKGSLKDNVHYPKNVIIILCESLESWVLNTEIEAKEITPNFNKLIKDSTTFFAPNVVTQVGSGRSIDAQLILLAGMLPMLNKVFAYEVAGKTYYTLPHRFKESGGKTYLLTCDKQFIWNQEPVAKAFGFDTLIYSKDFKTDEIVGPAKRLSDGSFMRQSIEKLKKKEIWGEEENAMIVMVTYSGHNPFKLPYELRSIDFNGDYPQIIKDYLATAHYTDASISKLIDYLKSRKDWEDTMVVIVGDHEGLASDRNLAISDEFLKTIVDPLQHTPLIILNSPIPGFYEDQLGQIDVYSSLLDLLGWDNYIWRGLGNSIFNNKMYKFAIGSSGQVVGDTLLHSDHKIVDHVKSARKISDLILKFDLLKNYQDLLKQ